MTNVWRALRTSVVSLLLTGLCAGVVEAGTFTLQWDRNPEANVTGYKVSWGTAPGTYGTPVDVGNQTSFLFSEPDATRSYYFSVQAYNSNGALSPYADEVRSMPAGTGTLTLDHTALYFGATKLSPTSGLQTLTPAQDVRVNFSGTTPGWTVAANQPWIHISTAYSVGAGTFTVTVVNPGNVVGTFAGSITLTAANIGITKTLPVTFAIQNRALSTPPFGSFDTPVNGANIQGSIAVTGWALDDVAVSRVEIWRDPIAGEAAYFGGGPGYGKVFIANALFIDGARPDIEAGYEGNPLAYKSGWGYLLLTWGLPQQGNGTFKLYAFAYDGEGQAALLGSKVVSADNARAVRPFGSLDTPGYGQVVSGGFWIYGWALTPKPNALDPRLTCALGAGSVQVGIDSGPLQTVTFGATRPDIASAFPGYWNSSYSGGAYYLDTTTLSNGVHQVGWLVTDTCGRADGIGSRTFIVQNSGTASAPDRIMTSLSSAPLAWESVAVRTNDGVSSLSDAGNSGVHVVTVEPNTRVEVQLPAGGHGAYAGAQIVGARNRALPVGSSLDKDRGLFSWQPPAGFLGSFELAFARSGSPEQTRVRIVIGPPMRMAIDTPQQGVVSRQFSVAGWALDLSAADGTGIDTVHVWAYPADQTAPIFLGVASVGDARTDVGAVYGSQFKPSSYNLSVSSLKRGSYDLVVYPHRAATNAFDAAQIVRVFVQ